jgi:hypothetical protein
LLATAVFATIHIPVIKFLFKLAISERLAYHLYTRRHEIDKWQDTLNEKLVKTEEEKTLLKNIVKRIKLEQVFVSTSKTEKLVDDASRSLGSISFVGDPGSHAKSMAAFCEFVSFYILSLAFSYMILGFNIVKDIGINWYGPLYVGLIVNIVLISIFAAIRWKKSIWPCVVCERKTRRIVRRGITAVHICSPACEQKLHELMVKSTA